MIPKKIHYIWFGEKRKPAIFKQCLKSWKKHCPDYEIILWNENNFDINQNDFCKAAYTKKYFQLLSDYARIKIIYEEGGIYLDIDVELIKNLDDLLNLDFYMGFQSNGKIGSGLGFGSTKNNLLLKKIIEYYESLILNSDYVFQPCPIIETKILEENGFLINGIKQKKDDMYLLPQDFFDPIGFLQDEIYITKNTYSIHHYTFSWGNVNDPNYKKYKVWYNKIQKKLRYIKWNNF